MRLFAKLSAPVFGFLLTSLSIVVSCQPYVNPGVDRIIHEKIVDHRLPLHSVPSVGMVSVAHDPYGTPLVYRSSEEGMGIYESNLQAMDQARAAEDARLNGFVSYPLAETSFRDNYRQNVMTPAELYPQGPYRYMMSPVLMAPPSYPQYGAVPAVTVQTLKSSDGQQYWAPSARTLGVIRDVIPGIFPGTIDREFLKPVDALAHGVIPGSYIPLNSYQHL